MSSRLFRFLESLSFTKRLYLKASITTLPGRLTLIGSLPRIGKTNGLTMISVGGTSDLATIKWMVPADFVVETHGHTVALYDADYKKTAEVFVESSAAVLIKKNHVSNEVIISSGEASRRINMYVRHEAFKLVERGISAPTTRWAQWHDGERAVTYLLEQPLTHEGRSRMIVVFSAIGAEYDFTYNYRSALSGVDAYRLYLLDDFGGQGSYYYADHRDESIYRSIQKFLRDTLLALSINTSDTIFAGSSKGGTAALIHGLPMSVGRIVAGAPQYRPGTYLRANAPAILRFIAGDATQSSRVWLDDIVGRAVEGHATDSRVRLLVGAADHHYKRHVTPLATELVQRGIAVQTLVLNGVDHQEIGKSFSAYLSQVVRSPTGSHTEDALLPYELTWKHGRSSVAVLRLWLPVGESVAIKGFSRGSMVASSAYSETETYSVSVKGTGPVRFRIYRRSTSTGRRTGAFTTRWLRRPS